MEEPNYITVQDLLNKLAEHPGYMPVVGADGEFITTTENDSIDIQDSAGCHTYGVVRIC